MTDHSHLPSATATIVLGWLSAGWGWLFADMPGIAILIAVTTLALTCVKLKAAWSAHKEKAKDVALGD